MNNNALKHIDTLIERYPQLASLKEEIIKSVDIIIKAYENQNKIMVCGNGGSAADSLHIVGELMKAFILPRKLTKEIKNALEKTSANPKYLQENLQMAMPAISLVNEVGLLTAYANDVAPDLNFAQQVLGQGKKGDILIAISTSGNSENVLYATEVAKAMEIKTIALTGQTGGKLKDLADITLNVPEKETYKIQELHLPVYHAICLALEAHFYTQTEA